VYFPADLFLVTAVKADDFSKKPGCAPLRSCRLTFDFLQEPPLFLLK